MQEPARFDPPPRFARFPAILFRTAKSSMQHRDPLPAKVMRRLARTALLAAGLCLAFLLQAPSDAHARNVALVIANSIYLNAPSLRSRERDAPQIVDALEKSGFSVQSLIDQNYQVTTARLRDFEHETADADVALIYFIGRSSAVNGENWLFTIDADVGNESDLRRTTLNARELTQIVSNAKRLGLVLLDASYDNPFPGASSGRRSFDKGLAPMVPPSNVVIISAAEPGRVAIEDDRAAVGPFTKAFLDNLGRKNTEISAVLGEIKKQVTAATGGQQRPTISSAAMNEIYLNGKDQIADRSLPAPSPDSDAETALWNAIKDSSNPDLLTAYSKRFPNSQFAELARRYLLELQRVEALKQQAQTRSITLEQQLIEALKGAKTRSLSTTERDPAMPDFPWPPPKASAFDVIPADLIHIDEHDSTLAAVAGQLGKALDAAAYTQRSFFTVPGGFAMVTQLERINPDGTPDTKRRWQPVASTASFSLEDYLKRLLYADPGRYRLVVFIVTDAPFSASGDAMTARQASSLVARGTFTLAETTAKQPYSTQHRATALIYEFRKGKAAPELVLPSEYPGRSHLVKAKMWAALQNVFHKK
jgi:hypothetical protein